MNLSLTKLSLPFSRGEKYPIGKLRAFASVPKHAEHSERSKIDMGEIPWAKVWREELRPVLLLADALELGDSDTFQLMPEGDPIDVVMTIDNEIIPLQITVADPDWKKDGKGGYVRRLEIEKLRQDGHCFGGGDIS